MTWPLVSVVVETITAREHPTTVSLADDLAASLAALGRQTYPHDLIETIVVLDDGIDPRMADEVRGRYPTVTLGYSSERNYFAAKNAGVRLASGSIVALLDADCAPAPTWLQTLVSGFEPDVAAVAGRTRYAGDSRVARTFSVPDFANVLEDARGAASGFLVNNVALRRDVLLAHPFEVRIRRNGGCYLLYHQLRAAGARIVYEPRAVVAHGLDIRGLGFVRKHFDRGYDAVSVYRLDDRAVLRGTRLFRRLGGLALVAIAGRRIVVDWVRLARHRRQIGVSAVALPYFGAVALGTRLIELAGGLTAVMNSRAPVSRNGLAG
jgi:glycosyltransferase involved in cell wall biosynthesis